MKTKKWLLLIGMLIAVMALPITANAAKVKLNKKSATLTVGKTVQLKVKGTKSKVKWSSSNKKVATVSKKGKVTAKSAGSATIKAKVDKKTYKCKVTVNAAAAPAQTAAASLSETKLEMIAGQQKQLTLNNASGYVTWSSNNHRVADVASDGTVYAKFYGTCVIRATCGGKTYNCAVSVTFPDPECYPKTSYSYSGDSGELKIDTFEAKFVSYQQDRTDVVTIEDGDYFFFYPCIYRIHLKGSFPYKTSDANIPLLSMWEGHIYADFFGAQLKIVTDENGDFDVTQDVRFSGPAEIIYMVD